MTTLHILNKAPEQARAHQCLAAALAAEKGPHGVLLLENGVYCTQDPAWAEALKNGLALWALEPDVAARSLAGRIPGGIQQTDYDGFVELTVRFDNIVSW